MSKESLRDIGLATLPHRAPISIFDTETTGVDVEGARIVTAHLSTMVDGEVTQRFDWLINPGVPIPEEATAVHGITDQTAAEGDHPMDAIPEIIALIHNAQRLHHQPLVAFNAVFDLTILDREARRVGIHEGIRPLAKDWVILDPFVIDKVIDKYRPGKRTLGAVAEHYGLQADGELHGAAVDAQLAGRVMLHLWEHTDIAGYPAAHLHERTIEHYRSQAHSFADYLHGQGAHDRATSVAAHDVWPIHPPQMLWCYICDAGAEGCGHTIEEES